MRRTHANPGRPPKPPQERLEPSAMIRLAPPEREALERAARAAGLTPGPYCRRVLLQHLRRRRTR